MNQLAVNIQDSQIAWLEHFQMDLRFRDFEISHVVSDMFSCYEFR